MNSVVWDFSNQSVVQSKGWNTAIYLQNTSNTSIIGVTVTSACISNCFYDIVAAISKTDNSSASYHNTFFSLIFNFNGTIGIGIYSASNTTISNTLVENFQEGIVAFETNNISIVKSKVSNSTYGIYFYNTTSVGV